MIITIDGPSGTGKSTVAKGVAKALGFTFFDTGAMYRCFAWLVLREKINPEDQNTVIGILDSFDYAIKTSQDNQRIYSVQGIDVTDEIRTQAISNIASKIATYPEVREKIVQIQRSFGNSVNAVFEGRDMGTVVFPEAYKKFFLTASSKVRAERRFRELKQKYPDQNHDFSQILKEIEERDHVDSNRKISPLKRANDAILIDTSLLSADEVIHKIVNICKPQKKKLFNFGKKLSFWILKFFYKYEVKGEENLIPGCAIIAANHASNLDPVVVCSGIFDTVQIFAKNSLFDFPLFSSLLSYFNAHPILGDGKETQGLKIALKLLKEGHKVLLFPEGNRTFDGHLQPFEKGIGFLAQKAQCAIIPAYVYGTFNVWPRHKRFPKLFGNVGVKFGKPIFLHAFKDAGKKEVIDLLTEHTELAVKKLKFETEAKDHVF